MSDVPDDGPAFVEIEARVSPDPDGRYTRRDLLVAGPFFAWLKDTLLKSEELARDYATAKVAQETNTAKKLAEEAGELAARRDKALAEAGVIRQQGLSRLIKTLHDIGRLPSHLQAVALLQLMQQEPALFEQVERLKSLAETLKVLHGVSLAPSPVAELATGSDPGP